jgi:CRISPR-associated endoribonuclease Cas6
MRYKLRFLVDHNYGSLLPLNYQLEVYRLIRDILADDAEAYKDWLRCNGLNEYEKLQIFNFSNLIVLDRKIYGDRLLVMSDTVELILSFFHERFTDEFVNFAFANLVMTLGDQKSKIKLRFAGAEKLPSPNFSGNMQFIARSPIVVQNFESTRYVKFMSPVDDNYIENFTQTMLNKYERYYGHPYENQNFYTSIELLTEPKSKLLGINNNQRELVKGYLFRFSLTAPQELLEIGYKIGFGDKNHLGFGFCDILFSSEKKSKSEFTREPADSSDDTPLQVE